MSLADLTANSVRLAIDEFRRIGREAFLKKYGFGRGVRYFLSDSDDLVDSKAVAGAAHGFLNGQMPLKASEFSGGDNTVAKRLREALRASSFCREEGLNLNVRASIGLATYPHDAQSPHDVIRQADEMMYLVKNTTRDNIGIAQRGVLK